MGLWPLHDGCPGKQAKEVVRRSTMTRSSATDGVCVHRPLSMENLLRFAVELLTSISLQSAFRGVAFGAWAAVGQQFG